MLCLTVVNLSFNFKQTLVTSHYYISGTPWWWPIEAETCRTWFNSIWR